MGNDLQLSGVNGDVITNHLGFRIEALLGAADNLVKRLYPRNLHITTVESCTGGALVFF